jgi:mRNA interferase MazF
MAILSQPCLGTILICDFDQGFKAPEMVKRWPVVVVSPQTSWRPGLCTVVALSTPPPFPVRPYHCRLILDHPLPAPWDSEEMWVKGDIILAAGFHRLNLIRTGRGSETGKRQYHLRPLSDEQLKSVRACVLQALGLFGLTKHL